VTASVVVLALVLVGLDPLIGVFAVIFGVSTVRLMLLITPAGDRADRNHEGPPQGGCDGPSPTAAPGPLGGLRVGRPRSSQL